MYNCKNKENNLSHTEVQITEISQYSMNFRSQNFASLRCEIIINKIFIQLKQ